jgi:hypothetical protein
MKRMICACVLAIPVAALAGQNNKPSNTREEVTVDYFLESCTDIGGTAGGLIKYFDCDSYIYGILDTYAEVSPFIPVAQRACIPKSLTPSQFMNDAWHLDIKLGPRTAAPVLIDMLRKKYPCK